MKKIIISTISLLLFSSILYSQTSDKNYSESVVYEPIEFNVKENKTKKDKQRETVGEIREIEVPVSVFRKGKFVAGLQKSDFKIFVDDKEIKDFTLEMPDESLSVILIFDTSPSTDFRIEEIRKFADLFVEQFKDTDKIQIVEFNDRLRFLTDLTDDGEAIKKGISRLNFGDGTALYDTIQSFFEAKIDKIKGRKVVVLITDGVDTTSRKSNYSKSLEQAEKYHIPIYPVYVDSLKSNRTELNKTPSVIITGGRIVESRTPPRITETNYDIGKQYLNDLIHISGGRVGRFDNFTESKKEVLPYFTQELRQKYYLKFAAAADEIIGQRKQIKVRINQPDLFITARGSYILGKTKN